MSTDIKLVAEERLVLVLVKVRDEKVVSVIQTTLADAVKESRQVTFNGDWVLSLRLKSEKVGVLADLAAIEGIVSIVVRFE